MGSSVSSQALRSYFDGGLLQFIGWVLLGVIVTVCTLGICLPWAVCMIYGWEVKHTVINGHRLRFTGTAWGLFKHWILWWILTVITLGLFGLWVPIKIKKWITSNSEFADGEIGPCAAEAAADDDTSYTVLLALGIVISAVGIFLIFRLPLWQAYAIVAVGIAVLVAAGKGGDATNPVPLPAARPVEAPREQPKTAPMPSIKTTVHATFRHRYDVVGESFDNEDGTSRQEILDAIANGEPPYENCEVSLDEFDYKGERALAVKVNGDQIGCIARKDLDAVFSDLDLADAITLKVFGGDNGKNYGAAITLIANADD